jgi:AcrR family transcriptional regulator
MKKRLRKDAQETRQRLLAAAGQVFAEQGFWEATHAEICRRAQANIAAVNYHFGSKENLYVEAWKHAFALSVQAHPPDGGVAPDAPVEERLRGQIRAFMDRIADPDNYEVEIMHKEMANPTGLLGEAMRRVIEPMREAGLAVMRELLGDGVPDQQVQLCEMSIMGQCFGPMLHLRRTRKGSDGPQPPVPPMLFDVEELVDHIVRFSLAGVCGIRKNVQKDKMGVQQAPRGKRVSKQRHS